MVKIKTAGHEKTVLDFRNFYLQGHTQYLPMINSLLRPHIPSTQFAWKNSPSPRKIFSLSFQGTTVPSLPLTLLATSLCTLGAPLLSLKVHLSQGPVHGSLLSQAT